jgi:DNA-binding NarL/FixJ family response regulator
LRNALIVAKTGPLQDGLQALLAAQPNMDIVTVANSLASALAYVSERCPTLILLVIDSLDERQKELLFKLYKQCAKTRILVLVDSEKTRQEISNIEVDILFNRGINVRELSRQIDTFLTV